MTLYSMYDYRQMRLAKHAIFVALLVVAASGATAPQCLAQAAGSPEVDEYSYQYCYLEFLNLQRDWGLPDDGLLPEGTDLLGSYINYAQPPLLVMPVLPTNGGSVLPGLYVLGAESAMRFPIPSVSDRAFCKNGIVYSITEHRHAMDMSKRPPQPRQWTTNTYVTVRYDKHPVGLQYSPLSPEVPPVARCALQGDDSAMHAWDDSMRNMVRTRTLSLIEKLDRTRPARNRELGELTRIQKAYQEAGLTDPAPSACDTMFGEGAPAQAERYAAFKRTNESALAAKHPSGATSETSVSAAK